MAVLSLLSPKPPAPHYHVSLVHSALPLLEPRVSGCKQNFVCWPFKRLSAFPAISPWQTETLLLFTAGCHLGSFPSSGDIGWGAQLGVRPHTSQGDPAQSLKYPSGTSAASLGAQPALSHLCTPYQYIVVKWFLLSIHGHKASLQLVFGWLFRMISSTI